MVKSRALCYLAMVCKILPDCITTYTSPPLASATLTMLSHDCGNLPWGEGCACRPDLAEQKQSVPVIRNNNFFVAGKQRGIRPGCKAKFGLNHMF